MGVVCYIFKSLDVSSNILFQSPPLSPPLSNTDVTAVVKEELIEGADINDRIKETEVSDFKREFPAISCIYFLL